MHHIKKDILTSHLSPTLTELRWRVLRYVWPNPGMSQRVQWFFRFHRWREMTSPQRGPLTACEKPCEMWLPTWKAANCDRFPDFVSGLRSGEDCPVLPMRRSMQSALVSLQHAGVWPQISNSRQFLLQQSFHQVEGYNVLFNVIYVLLVFKHEIHFFFFL